MNIYKILILVAISSVLLIGLVLVTVKRNQGFKDPISSSSDNWKEISVSQADDGAAYIDLFFFDREVGVALTVGSIETSYDGGKSWKTTHIFRNRAIYDLVVDDQGALVAGKQFIDGERGLPVLMYSRDQGVNWSDVVIPPVAQTKLRRHFSVITGICFDGAGNLWLVGDGGMIKATIADAKLEILEVEYTEAHLSRIFFGNSQEIWASGPEGDIARYRNGKWEYQQLGKNRMFSKVLIKENSVWLVGLEVFTQSDTKAEALRGVLLKSSDGTTWEDKSPEHCKGLTDIYFGGNRGFVVGLGGVIFTTIDNGESWTSVPSPTKANLYVVSFNDSETGWISGDRSIVLRYEK